MKFDWDHKNTYLYLPLQKDAIETEIRYFVDEGQVAARTLPLSQTRVDTWLCISLKPFGARASLGIEVDLDNLWIRNIFVSRDENLVCLGDVRSDWVLHYSKNQGRNPLIQELFQTKDGTWQLRFFTELLGKAVDYWDLVTLESPDLLDWHVAHVDYNLERVINSDQQDLRLWQGAVRQEFIVPTLGGLLTLAVSDLPDGFNQANAFSLPFMMDGQKLSPIDGLRKLRIWERHWKDIHTSKFEQNLSFRIAPGHWPNIRILEPEGKVDDISAQAFEFVINLEYAKDDQLKLDLCGFHLGIIGTQIDINGNILPISGQAGQVELTVLIDRTIAEIICCDKALVVQRVIPSYETTQVDNISGNLGDCQIDLEPVNKIHIESEGEFTIRSLHVFGMRSAHYSLEAQRHIKTITGSSPLFYSGKTFAVYGNRVTDHNYGHPDAFVTSDGVVISPVRVTEEFQWRDTPWGDMVRVINRTEIWRPAFNHLEYPRFRSGIQSLDAAYEIAVDNFAACKSDCYALPGQSGMWSAGLFQGPGQGFGVWLRDSAHIALRCGNLLDPQGARKTLLYTVQKGFDNGVDGPAMAIVGLWDYFLATHDHTLLLYVWPYLLEKIRQVESRFSEQLGLVDAAQSTSNDAFDEPENGGYCLSTECYFMKAYSDMANIGKLLGYDQEKVGHWQFRAQQMKDAINMLFWNDTLSYYTAGPKGSQSYAQGYWETSGAESVIWSKFAIADPQRTESMLKALHSKAMTDYGIQLFPYRREKNHFCNSIWVVWQAGFADAASAHQDIDLIHKLIGQQIRNCIINKTFYEVIEAQNGLAWRWPGQLWHAAGFISLLFYGLLGIYYDETGLHFRPAVPKEFATISLERLRYGEALLDVVLEGHGADFELLVDGVKSQQLNWGLSGRHQVKLIAKQGD